MFHIPELTDQIIDHLHADPTSLRNCALVARSWTPASQLHIFFSVNIKDDATCRLLCDIITQSPHIGRYIHNIYIYFDVTRPLFSSLLDLRIPAPRRLSIVNCPHTAELALIRHLFQLPSLTDIRFFSGTSVSRSQLEYLAHNRIAKLGSLMLYSASDTPALEDKDWTPLSSRSIRVTALNVSGEATLVTSMLTDPEGPIHVVGIEALTFDTPDTPCLPRLLAISGPELVVLELSVSSSSLASQVHIGRSTIPYLIDLLLYDITATTLPAVVALCAQLDPTAALRTLRLAPSDRPPDSDSEDDNSGTDSTVLAHRVSSPFAPKRANYAQWRALDGVLGALSALEAVDVEGVPPHASAGLLECLPGLVRRGIVHVRRAGAS
ncbi:hypothetical protein DFH08DRAFT_1024730, partial [Mycena albidolilacea]